MNGEDGQQGERSALLDRVVEREVVLTLGEFVDLHGCLEGCSFAETECVCEAHRRRNERTGATGEVVKGVR